MVAVIVIPVVPSAIAAGTAMPVVSGPIAPAKGKKGCQGNACCEYLGHCILLECLSSACIGTGYPEESIQGAKWTGKEKPAIWSM